MLFMGRAGLDAVIKAYMGDLASGTIGLWYTGGGYGEDPRDPGQKILPKTVSASGATVEYVIPASLLTSWHKRDGQLNFLVNFLGNTLDNSDWRSFLRIENDGEALRAKELARNLNGTAPPYKSVECAKTASGVASVQAFTLDLS